MKATRIMIGALSASLLVLSLLAFAPLHQQAADSATWRATWVFHPRSLAETRQRATAIVTARVTAVTKGPDIVVAAPGEPNGEDRLETQRVTFEVLKTYKGKAGDTITLFRTGTDTKYIEGDRPYHVGETHLLFVEPKADEAGTFLVVAPEGRYQIQNGKLLPESSEGFAAALSGRDVAQVEQALAKP